MDLVFRPDGVSIEVLGCGGTCERTALVRLFQMSDSQGRGLSVLSIGIEVSILPTFSLLFLVCIFRGDYLSLCRSQKKLYP